MRTPTGIFMGLILAFLQIGCANIKLVSSENNQYKFCTNPGNKIAQESDFDAAASQKCGGHYRSLSQGLEFFTDPKAKKIAGFLEVQTERRMCHIYECTEN